VPTRGGAYALYHEHSEVTFDVRVRAQESEKRAIARAAAAMVEDGEAIALDSSTSAYYVALELCEKQELVVVTNGLRAAMVLARAPGVSVILPGGELQLAAMSIVGNFASRMLEATRISTGFFGARGINIERGLMDLSPFEVRIKREIANACDTVVGIVDSTKWHRTALLSFIPVQQIDAIVTDEGAPEDAVAQWRDRNVQVVSAAK
jgi:DeoR family transcriptional regulator of aga operon